VPTSSPDDLTIKELLDLAKIPRGHTKARRWLADALESARMIEGADPRPSKSKFDAPLQQIECAADALIDALDRLARHPHAHAAFWLRAVGRTSDESQLQEFKSALNHIRALAHGARLGKGRPRAHRKQRIVGLALAFWARFQTAKPSSDPGNAFFAFAERFYEHATGRSTEKKGEGIIRQVREALRLLPMESERAARLNKTTL
jgi:hypothetical protein